LATVITSKTVDSSNTNIFIVHGHNVAVQQSVARTLEKLGLNPIILSEQPNAGNTIIEKFEANTDVGFAVILLTDDDEGKSKTDIDLKSRARQNVILELGYFIGRLGRKRVLPLYSEGVELPSDIHGLLFIPIDKADTWKFALVRELKEAGYNVDANSIL
jgi:predicted nucleotide-binding protein